MVKYSTSNNFHNILCSYLHSIYNFISNPQLESYVVRNTENIFRETGNILGAT